MSTPTPGSQAYLSSAVMTATPEQLQLMLYDGAIRFALRGGDGIRSKDREASFNALDRAQQIVLELNNGLNREANPEVADQMIALHMFVYRRLVAANLNQDESALEEALSILRHQRETWALVVDRVKEARAGTPAPAPRSPGGVSRFVAGSTISPARPAGGDAPQGGFVAEG